MTTPEPTPLALFRDCHAQVFDVLGRLDGLCALQHASDREAEAREAALSIWRFFRETVLVHHEEEEEELFPMVLHAAADDGPARAAFETAVKRLAREHRELEAAWERIEPRVRKLARGKQAKLEQREVADLTHRYRAHARYEEEEFLPQADELLGRHPDERQALARALHGRHSGLRIPGYA